MIRLRNVAPPRNEEDMRHLRTLAGVLMAQHVRAPWWDVKLKLTTYVAARAYAKRSLEWWDAP